MKRILSIIIILLISLQAFSQIKILTKGEKLRDFPMRQTKVVLSGNPFLDRCIKEAVKNTWLISPFEFCSKEDFEILKTRDDYYFMISTILKHCFESKHDILALKIVKGGSGDKIDKMLEVVEFPICSKSKISTRLENYLPAIVNIMQNYIKQSLYSTFSNIHSKSLSKARGKPIYLAKSDLAFDLDNINLDKFTKKNIFIVDDTSADSHFINRENALVSYCINSADFNGRHICYKMLFDAKTHELYYLKKYNCKQRAGFTKYDLFKMRFLR